MSAYNINRSNQSGILLIIRVTFGRVNLNFTFLVKLLNLNATKKWQHSAF
jgi:hypothetical protein